MRERLLVLALAVGALALFYVLFLPKPTSAAGPVVFPLSSESGPEGQLAVWRWLGDQQIPALSLRYRYDRLPGLLPKATGNLLIMTLPQRVPARLPELTQLQQWVEAGNTLLILDAIDDRPAWALLGDPLAQDKLQRLTGLTLTAYTGGMSAKPAPVTGALKQVLAGAPLDLEPLGAHPLLAGVRHLAAVSTLPVSRSAPQGDGEVLPLALAARTDTHEAALWLLRRGAGQILLSSAATLFSNRAVPLADNARLLANLAAWSRGEGGSVVFDDAHQGATAYYDANAFFADPRLHRTLIWIVLLWLAFVLGALPLSAARRTIRPLDETAYIEAGACYLAAVVPPAQAAQQLIERFLESTQPLDVDARDGSPASLWEPLDTHPRVNARQRRALHDLYEKACTGGRVDLARLQNLLAQLRELME